MISKGLLFISIFFCPIIYYAQADSSSTLTFDFNDHEIKEKDDKIIPRAEGVTLTADRFGNERSAVYLHGNVTSYLNLSTSNLLKPIKGTISLWVSLDRRVYSGKGYDNNPIIYTKNEQELDFNVAYEISYDCYSKRLIAYAARDSLKDVSVGSVDKFKFGLWYHLVIVFDNNYLIFYVDGKLQNKVKKCYKTTYLLTDSVMIGHTASSKNERYSEGVFDDIQFFHRILSEQEISELYEAPNPNRIKNIFSEILKYGVIIILLVLTIIILIVRNRNALNRQKEQLELVNRITELELKVVKSQMNPHFISNCLAAIQELIYKNEIDKAVQYIAKFSYFLRQVLNYSDKNLILLAEEIQIINLNVELEQLRFKNEFSFEVNSVEDMDLKEILIPSLITQPFIENAIWHGLLPLGNMRKPKLKVNIFLQDGLPIIEIEDNGVGRNLKDGAGKNSKGTKLVSDKIESLNRLNQTSNYKMEIIDLFDDNQKMGTKIRIQLENILK
ncbi:MAG: histidine kinase [Bacteroidota bacterium]